MHLDPRQVGGQRRRPQIFQPRCRCSDQNQLAVNAVFINGAVDHIHGGNIERRIIFGIFDADSPSCVGRDKGVGNLEADDAVFAGLDDHISSRCNP